MTTTARTKRNHAPRNAYGIFTEDGLDQVTYGSAQAVREAKDLRALGCTVVGVKVEGVGDRDAAFEAINERLRGSGDGCISARLLKRVGAELGLVLTKANI